MTKIPSIDVIMAHLRDGLTYEQIGQRYGISRQHIGEKISACGRLPEAHRYAAERRDRADQVFVDLIRPLAEQGWDIAMIHDETGLSTHRISRIVAEQGWRTSRHLRKEQLILAQRETKRNQKIASLRQQGMTMTDLGTKFDLSPGQVSRILRAQGITVRDYHSRTVDSADVLDMYQSGFSTTLIAKHLDVTKPTISYHLRKLRNAGLLDGAPPHGRT